MNHPDDDDRPFCSETVTCPVCGKSAPTDEFDAGLACPGKVFCTDCHTEIDDEDRVALLCGNCYGCVVMKEGGKFDQLQAARASLRDEQPDDDRTRCSDCGKVTNDLHKTTRTGPKVCRDCHMGDHWDD